ncbi:MAG: 3-oxoacyl-ACP reductase FabG [Rickettsiaceae bacterium]|nr:3-oxoacyl-ACP reductase FabG [Rickettsiaceae bacterium]
MIDLTDTVAVVTGSTGGIGNAIAKMLHSLGSHVYITGTNQDRLDKLATELGNNFTAKLCNLANAEECNQLISDIEKLDILVCNAGITKDGLAMRMTEEVFDSVLDVNLKANFILNREAIKKMIKKRYGRIINISSIVATSGNPGQANYCAAKAGLIGMTKSLAYEVANRGVTVNAVSPGFIATNMTDSLTEAQKEAIMQKIPMKLLGKPEDVANIVAFLASHLSSYITGQTFHVNGGMLMV